MGGKKKGGNNNQQQDSKEKEFKFDFAGGKPTLDKDTQAALMPVLQHKLESIIGKSSGYLETLPLSVQNRVKALKHLQEKHDDFEDEFQKELTLLESKYESLKKPLYERRSEIVNGGTEPKPEELILKPKENNEAEEKDKKEEENKPQTVEKGENIKGIPDFWLEVLKHHPDFEQMITPEDEKVLKSLVDIKCSHPEGDNNSPSFTIEFHFASNDYFTDSILKKTFYLYEEEAIGETMFDHTESTEIAWKDGKNLTVKSVTKQIGGGKGGRRGGRGGNQPKKTVVVQERADSFFNFFSPEPTEELEDPEDQEELQAMLEQDYEFGMSLKSSIIPNAIMWFTGEVPMMEDEGFEDDVEDEEDDEDEEEEEVPVIKGKKTSPKKKSTANEDGESSDEEFDPSKHSNAQQQPECKQQ